MHGRPPMKWWGWGSPDVTVGVPPQFLTRLERDLGKARTPPDVRRPPALDRVRPVSLASDARNDDVTRLAYAAGKSYLDLVRLRGPRIEAPDAVAFPANADEVAAIVRRSDIAVVPFGGGTSVVGGVAPLRGEHAAVVTLDTSRLDRILEIDDTSMTITAEAGVFGPALERAAGARGLTLSHYPQSFEYSTVGGWIAARSAGQESTRYGRIETMVTALTAVTAAGTIATRNAPASATGPEIRELLVGSEGTLGVITQATLRLHRIPETRRFASYLFREFGEGLQACREIVQSGVRPAVLRLSDETETDLALDLHATSPGVRRLLAALGRGHGAILVLAFDGSGREARRDGAAASRIARRAGGLPLGSSPGRRWQHERFEHPYLRDALIDRGYMVDTFETATTWSRLSALHAALKTAAPGLAGCHVSHAYTDGASLYFTVIDKATEGAEEAQWHEFKRTVTDAIANSGGTISHHHGVGIDHKPWLPSERGEAGLAVLSAIKRELDPHGVMNPGKLV